MERTIAAFIFFILGSGLGEYMADIRKYPEAAHRRILKGVPGPLKEIR